MKNHSTENAADEKVLRQKINEYVAAIRVKDIEKVMEIFAPNLVSFDLKVPLSHVGAEAKRKNWTKAFAAYKYPIGYEIQDFTITIADSLAVGRASIKSAEHCRVARKQATGYVGPLVLKK